VGEVALVLMKECPARMTQLTTGRTDPGRRSQRADSVDAFLEV
jgi:hypothetical protein